MGFFSKILGGGGGAPTAFTKEESFTGLLLAAIAADGYISNEEIADFHSFVTKSKLLSSMNGNEYNKMIDKLLKVLRKEGVDALVDASATSLPENLRESVFAIACDLFFSDGTVDSDEEKLLEKIKDLLEINDALATKIVEVMVIKNAA